MSVSQEEAIPELEIDVDELLDMENDADRAARVKVCFHIKSSGLQIITFSTYNYKMYTFDSGVRRCFSNTLYVYGLFCYPTGPAGRLL